MYISKVMSLLNNTEHYRKLDEDPTDILVQAIKNVLSDMMNHRSINEEIACGLLPGDIRVSRFHFLPKIHKPRNPGRPIVSFCGAPSEGISCFVNFHFGPLVRKIPSYIKGAMDVLIKLNTIRKLPIGTILETLDVTYIPTFLTKKGLRPVGLHWKQAKSNNL